MFNDQCIDFVGTNKKISPGKQEPIKRAYKKSDFFKITNMADSIIDEHIGRDKILGVKACIQYQIRCAKFTNYFGPNPFKTREHF